MFFQYDMQMSMILDPLHVQVVHEVWFFYLIFVEFYECGLAVAQCNPTVFQNLCGLSYNSEILENGAQVQSVIIMSVPAVYKYKYYENLLFLLSMNQ